MPNVTLTVDGVTITGRHEPDGFHIDTFSADTENGETEEAISNIAAILHDLVSDYPENIRSDVVHSTVWAFVEAANTAGNIDEPEYLYSGVSALAPDAAGEFLLQYIGGLGNPDTEKLNDKGILHASRVAEAIGPDWAQILYRFAVLVTKLA